VEVDLAQTEKPVNASAPGRPVRPMRILNYPPIYWDAHVRETHTRVRVLHSALKRICAKD
jgi:hypothetical protein